MFYNFWCTHCLRHVDSNCHDCDYFHEAIFYRYQALGCALENLKNVFDDCDDVYDIKRKARLNMASAFDTALDCYDDSLTLDLDEFIMDYEPDNLPYQFPLDFFNDPIDSHDFDQDFTI